MDPYKIVSEAIQDDEYYKRVVANRPSSKIAPIVTTAGGYIAASMGAYKLAKIIKARKNKIINKLSFPAAIFGYLTILTASFGVATSINKMTAKSYKKKLLKNGPKFYYQQKLKFIITWIKVCNREIAWLKDTDTIALYKKDNEMDNWKQEMDSYKNQLKKLYKDKKETEIKLRRL